MLNGVADSRESSSLSELSHPAHNITCYKKININVIHTTRLNGKAKSKRKKKRKEDKYLISIDLDLVLIREQCNPNCFNVTLQGFTKHFKICPKIIVSSIASVW